MADQDCLHRERARCDRLVGRAAGDAEGPCCGLDIAGWPPVPDVLEGQAAAGPLPGRSHADLARLSTYPARSVRRIRLVGAIDRPVSSSTTGSLPALVSRLMVERETPSARAASVN